MEEEASQKFIKSALPQNAARSSSSYNLTANNDVGGNTSAPNFFSQVNVSREERDEDEEDELDM